VLKNEVFTLLPRVHLATHIENLQKVLGPVMLKLQIEQKLKKNSSSGDDFPHHVKPLMLHNFRQHGIMS